MSLRGILIFVFFCLPMSLVGIAVFALGSFGAAERDSRITDAGVQTTAWVTDKEYSPGLRSRDPAQYIVRYNFSLADGTLVEGASIHPDVWDNTEIGSPIKVYYDAAQPQNNFPVGAGFSVALALGMGFIALMAQIPTALLLYFWWLKRRYGGAE
ncbi:DUF3592 domain-containing protein [Comamonas sp. NLF-1-9]|uniref:DUF3592 domain-containing protein n=1 Tax=Comamonas sp. NLF-1-9 TaxID=2853163 RepID=UPI001C4564DA|nr:DUF3592 domain-containing protein [Comamonas sp. NLF-1-9]QXL85384.1 DUF3592 domain-containing protein [Comamonas sp. NLF-1-9]